jgi:hypothetical protein
MSVNERCVPCGVTHGDPCDVSYLDDCAEIKNPTEDYELHVTWNAYLDASKRHRVVDDE